MQLTQKSQLLRYSSTIQDAYDTNAPRPQPQQKERGEREATKSDKNQAKTERAPQAAAKKSTADVKDKAKGIDARRRKEMGEELVECIMELATSAAADENQGTSTESRHDKSEQRCEKDRGIRALIEERKTIGKKTKSG